ncbi:MAG TPA: hypothetical protein VJ183_18925 [Chloroflexia bacterium]|nr:hypothetical protein [Chloroflexia bacterium]
MFLFFLFLLVTLTLPSAAIWTQIRLAKRLSKSGNLPRTLGTFAGAAILTMAVWWVIAMPIAIAFILGCPGATQMSPVWLMASSLFTYTLGLPVSGSTITLLLIPGSLLAIGLAAWTMFRRGVLPVGPSVGPFLPRPAKFLSLSLFIIVPAAVTFAGNRIAYTVVVPEARQIPLYPNASMVAVGKLDYAYELSPYNRVIHFHTRDSLNEVISYYTETLAKQGWVTDEERNSYASRPVFTNSNLGENIPYGLELTISQTNNESGMAETAIDIEVLRVPKADVTPLYPGATQQAVREEKDAEGFLWRETVLLTRDEAGAVVSYYMKSMPEIGWFENVPYYEGTGETLYDWNVTGEYMAFTDRAGDMRVHIATKEEGDGKTRIAIRVRVQVQEAQASP